MREKTPEELVGRLMELCNITQNKMAHELPLHYRQIDAVRDEIVEKLKK